jgi:ribosomal protein S18 acetylase RimI-like enzyme
MSAVIRRANINDAEVLAELGASTFVETFGHLYKPGDLRHFLEESHTAAAYARTLANPGYALWIAERDGHAIGYAQAGPCGLPHEEVRPGDGELKRLYLRQSEQNGGVGRALMDAAMAWLERDGPRQLWISVWSENTGAQRIYARHGFEYAGENEFPVGEQRDREIMFRRRPRA